LEDDQVKTLSWNELFDLYVKTKDERDKALEIISTKSAKISKSIEKCLKLVDFV